MVKVQDKIAKAVECLEYFTTHQWRFKDDNVKALLNAMSQSDRDNFQFDVKSIEWNRYLERYVLGYREFLFKQSPSSLSSSRAKMRKYVTKPGISLCNNDLMYFSDLFPVCIICTSSQKS